MKTFNQQVLDKKFDRETPTCRKMTRGVEHKDIVRPGIWAACFSLSDGWCVRYEGGSIRGVDSYADPIFYSPEGKRYRRHEMKEQFTNIFEEWIALGFPWDISTY